jgi:menaquinone-dependent protoporphyrinogen oxidase
MADKVLVAYGSKYGATKEIAEKVGEALKKEGLAADVVSADKVKEVTAYKAVVIGSAVYIGMWRKEVKKFIKNNEKALSERPVWIFSSGPTGEGDPVKQMSGWIIPPGLKPVIANIKPKDIAVFHGNVNVEKMSGMDKFVIKRVKSPVGDLRDWGMITEWAKKIAVEMKK